MTNGTIDKRKIARQIETGSSTIAIIPADMKTTAQMRELQKVVDTAKRDLARGKGLVIVSIAADKVTERFV